MESSFSLARPTHVEIDDDTVPTLPTPRESAAHAAYRARVGSDFAVYQAAFLAAHCATAAEANVTGSYPPDLQIAVDTLPIPDLIRVHFYIMKTLWSLRHLIALVHSECSAAHNTTRLMKVFADEASLDHHCARRT